MVSILPIISDERGTCMPTTGWRDEHFDVETLIRRMIGGHMDKEAVLTRMKWNGISRSRAEKMLEDRMRRETGYTKPKR